MKVGIVVAIVLVWQARLRSLANHAVFGVGLYLSALPLRSIVETNR